MQSIGRNEYGWRKYQANLYTIGLDYALPSISISLMIKLFRKYHDFLLISHKTNYTSEEFGRQNLRLKSNLWLEKNNFTPNVIDSTNIYYCDSQHEKISMINSLNLDIYIDDLEEVIQSNRINQDLKKIHFKIEDNSLNVFINSCSIIFSILLKSIRT